jgi:hypothetical protein
MAYYRDACAFFAWCDRNSIGEIADIEPLHVAAYIETLKVLEARKSAPMRRRMPLSRR